VISAIERLKEGRLILAVRAPTSSNGDNQRLVRELRKVPRSGEKDTGGEESFEPSIRSWTDAGKMGLPHRAVNQRRGKPMQCIVGRPELLDTKLPTVWSESARKIAPG
jgi:hypothetical protein